MNYDTMEAGREMDALVAEKVMGLDVTDVFCVDRAESEPLYPDKEGFMCHVAHYSTLISAAWEVVEKMKDANTDTACYDFDLIYQRYWGFGPTGGPHAEPIPEGERWVCQFGDEDKGIANAPTAPLAICRAALKAVEKHHPTPARG